jgi:hypothetical protein
MSKTGISAQSVWERRLINGVIGAMVRHVGDAQSAQ